MKLIKWKTVVREGDAWHFARAVCRPHAPFILHFHDFAEVFWVESGSGWHTLNGQRSLLAAGALVFIRPQDRHAFETERGGGAFTIANFAVPAAAAATFRQRWQDYQLEKIPWAREPLSWTLSQSQLACLGGIVRVATAGPPSVLAGDRFLSALMHELHREPSPLKPGPDAPEWLARAVAALHEPGRPPAGLEAFFRMAGRSREHVARACRRHLRLSPTELLDRLRMDHAARLLEQTDMPVLEIGFACGFANPSLFHRRFRAAFGRTPLRHRRQQRGSLPC
jgi:AraC family cel operon transcriptional repressor